MNLLGEPFLSIFGVGDRPGVPACVIPKSLFLCFPAVPDIILDAGVCEIKHILENFTFLGGCHPLGGSRPPGSQGWGAAAPQYRRILRGVWGGGSPPPRGVWGSGAPQE